VHGVAGVVITPCMVLQALLSHCMGVGAAVVTPCMMLRAPSSWHNLLHSRLGAR
jgi:hypothetical protein